MKLTTARENEDRAVAILGKIEALRDKLAVYEDLYGSQINKLQDELKQFMDMVGLPKAETGKLSAFWRRSAQADVSDWDAVMKYVWDNKAIDLIQRRISPGMLTKRLEAGEKINGVAIKESITFIVQSKRGGKKDEDSEG